MKKLLLAATALTVFAAPAVAADFTGPRVELRAGLDRVSIKDEEFGFDESKSGISYGIGAGYDFAVSESVILGVEANYDLSDTKSCEEIWGMDEGCIKAKRDLSVVARVGFKVSDNSLFYALAGYTNARVGATYVDYEEIFEDYSVAWNLDGIRLGVGLEYAFSNNMYVKAEYRYSNYEAGFSRNQALASIGFRF